MNGKSVSAPLVAITMGDVNGVGPEILAKVLSMPEVLSGVRILVIGDSQAYEDARTAAPGAPALRKVETVGDALVESETPAILDGGFRAPRRRPGILDAEAGRCAVEWVKLAVHRAMEGAIGAIVTCPLNKEGIHRAGYRYAGHTELIAEETGTADYRMALFAGPMRVVHNSAHCSLIDAVGLARPERIVKTLQVTDAGLARLGLPRRRIGVCGLNPHAGENGAFGREEIEFITPAIRVAQAQGIDAQGPYPADTIFNRMRSGDFDAVVAMYHDQGHAPMKLIAIDEGVNVTLGIPIVRTSVDHGTAYDIAGTGRARPDSLVAALRLGVELAGDR